jgi:four helix bundle protein
MDRIAEDLKGRARRFVLDILEFTDGFPETAAGQTLARQLNRAAVGVAGNYRSACRARSHKEFTARLGVVVEEVDESELWLDVANERRVGREALRVRLLDESRQLRAIFVRAHLTARRNDTRGP